MCGLDHRSRAGGGAGGGTIVCEGTPEEVAANPASHTAAYLARMLK